MLNKPDLLSLFGRELVRSHVRVGHCLISHVRALDEVADVVLHHHEWWNGTGYPDGLAGEDIPLASRIISVVDSYCAMITRRSYKEAFTDERARSELHRCAGTQFDPQVFRHFWRSWMPRQPGIRTMTMMRSVAYYPHLSTCTGSRNTTSCSTPSIAPKRRA